MHFINLPSGDWSIELNLLLILTYDCYCYWSTLIFFQKCICPLKLVLSLTKYDDGCQTLNIIKTFFNIGFHSTVSEVNRSPSWTSWFVLYIVSYIWALYISSICLLPKNKFASFQQVRIYYMFHSTKCVTTHFCLIVRGIGKLL